MVSKAGILVLRPTGLFRGGAGAQPAGLRLQSEGREGVQHGPVHPAPGRGRACSERRQDTCEFCLQVGLSCFKVIFLFGK